MRFYRRLYPSITALLACVLMVVTVRSQSLKIRKDPRLERGRQLAGSLDAADSFQTPRGKRELRRRMGEVAIDLAEGADAAGVIAELTGAGKPLARHTVDTARGRGFLVLQASRFETKRQLLDPTLHGQAMAAARSHPGVRSARPVFVDPGTGTWQILTGDLLVRLQPDTDPEDYFGADWPAARRMPGTQYHFILPRPLATAEELFAEVNARLADPRIRWVEPDFLGQAVRHFTPNDASFSGQWALRNTGQSGGNAGADVKAAQAWDITTGSSNIVIAILDDGVQINHPDLAANLFINANEILNGMDDDGNGYRDDVRGWDFVGNDNDPGPADPDDNHGTATAGVAAARGNNSIGVAGAAYQCRILPIKVITGSSFSTAALAQAIRYAGGVNDAGAIVWRGADVLSISLGFSPSAALDDAFADVAANGRGGKGCPIFASTGNEASGWIETVLENLAAGTHTFRWQYSKDVNVSEGSDTAWLDSISLPGSAVERFESTGLPSGWSTGGHRNWSSVVDGVGGNHALTGWNGPGSRAIRAGMITDNQRSYVQITRSISAGNLRYWAWVSSEQDFDTLDFYMDGVLTDFLSGNPMVITAAGYPASHAAVFGVGASTDFDFRADYSQYGAALEFVAPSSGGAGYVPTTDRTGTDGYHAVSGTAGDYEPEFGGTSASCPLAAGVGALLLSANPSLTATEVRDILRKTCDRIGGVSYVNDWNQFYGFGRINAVEAVTQSRVDLGVSQSVSPPVAQAGGNLTFTIAVTNLHLATARAVTVVDSLPAGLGFVSATTSQGSCTNAGGAITCNLGTVPNGASITILIVARALIDGVVTNTVTASASETDATPADNSATTTATITPVADLELLATISPDPAVVGENLVLTVTASNRGPSTATSVIVTNTLPGGVNFMAASVSQGTATLSGGVVVGDLGVLAAGANATLAVTITAPAPGTITNQAAVSAAVPDPTSANNAMAVVASVIALPPLTATRSGERILFSWPANAAGFVFESTDNLDPAITWSVVTNAPIPAGDQFTVTLDAVAGNRFFRLKRN